MVNFTRVLRQLQAERSRAAKELETLDNAIAAFQKLVGNHAPAAIHAAEATPKGSTNRRTLSADARKRISKAQKARWAKLRQNAA
jgi:hypothetical protein